MAGRLPVPSRPSTRLTSNASASNLIHRKLQQRKLQSKPRHHLRRPQFNLSNKLHRPRPVRQAPHAHSRKEERSLRLLATSAEVCCSCPPCTLLTSANAERRKKCSGEQPACSNCHRRGVDCVYPDTPRMRKGGRKRKDSSVAKSDDESEDDNEAEPSESKPTEVTIAGYVLLSCDDGGSLMACHQHSYLTDPRYPGHVDAHAIPQSVTVSLLSRSVPSVSLGKLMYFH